MRRNKGLVLTACLSLIALLTTGCTWSASPPMQPAGPRVALVSEQEFDQFAERIARQIPAAFSDPGVGLPPVLSLPSVSVERLNEQQAASDFGRTLIAGLNDRLGGKTRFDQTLESARGPRSTLVFTDADNGTNPDRRLVTFSIVDPAAERELLRESMEFEPLSERSRPAPPRPADRREPPPVVAEETADAPEATDEPPPPPKPQPRAAASTPRATQPPAKAPSRPTAQPRNAANPPPPARSDADSVDAAVDEEPRGQEPKPRGSSSRSKPAKLKLTLKGQELTDAIASRGSEFDARTHTGAGGNLIMLDVNTAERFWVQRIGSSRTSDDRLKVDIDLRSRGKTRDGEYRFVFYDDLENPVSSTGVIKSEFEAYRGQTISITAADRRATQWVCLFEED